MKKRDDFKAHLLVYVLVNVIALTCGGVNRCPSADVEDEMRRPGGPA